MSRLLPFTQQQQQQQRNIKSKSSQKPPSKPSRKEELALKKEAIKMKKEEAAIEKSLNAMHVQKVQELEAKLADLKRLIRNGRRHAGIELLAATTKKRLAKAKEMCDISTRVMHVKAVEDQTENEAEIPSKPPIRNKSPSSPNKSRSQEYGNYYSMRCNILHMENHKQTIIEAKGLQRFLSEYQKKLAKCFQFEQTKTVKDLFATNRIRKLSEQTIELPVKVAKSVKATESEASMTEVIMEKDLDTLVSTNRSFPSIFDDDYVEVKPSQTNFLNEFLNDKVLEFLHADAARLGYIQNTRESVSHSRLEHLMSSKTKINQSSASVNDDCLDKKLSKFRGKGSHMIPIKKAPAMINIKNRVV